MERKPKFVDCQDRHGGKHISTEHVCQDVCHHKVPYSSSGGTFTPTPRCHQQRGLRMRSDRTVIAGSSVHSSPRGCSSACPPLTRRRDSPPPPIRTSSTTARVRPAEFFRLYLPRGYDRSDRRYLSSISFMDGRPPLQGDNASLNTRN